MGVGQFAGLDHLLMSDVLSAEVNIFFNCCIEKYRLLRNNPNQLAKSAHLHLSHVHTVDQNLKWKNALSS